MKNLKLQEAIFDVERPTGVVATITNESGSKSAQLGQICQRLAQEFSWNRGGLDAGGWCCQLKEKAAM